MDVSSILDTARLNKIDIVTGQADNTLELLSPTHLSKLQVFSNRIGKDIIILPSAVLTVQNKEKSWLLGQIQQVFAYLVIVVIFWGVFIIHSYTTKPISHAG